MNLDFVGLERIQIVSGGADELSSLAMGDRWDMLSEPVTVLYEPSFGSNAYFVFSGNELEDLAARLRGVSDEDAMTSQIREVLSARQHVQIVRERDVPEQPAIVFADDGVTGVWITRESEGPDATRSPAPNRARGTAIDSDTMIRRTPHLDAPKTIKTSPGSAVQVAVRTDKADFAEGEEGEGIEIEAPPEVERLEVGVLLTTTEHFELEGERYKVLVIDRQRADSEPVRFDLRVVAHPSEEPRAAISALFVLNGRSCGRVARAWEWTPGEPEAGPARADPFGAAAVPLRLSEDRADLSVYIDSATEDSASYTCTVDTDLLPQYSSDAGPLRSEVFSLPHDADQLISRKLAEFTNPDKDAETRQLELRAAGTEFFKAAPSLFKEVLWALVDAGKRPETINITSAEPSLPWELMIPRRESGEPRALRPLGVEFAIGRWTRRSEDAPRRTLEVRNSLVIAPDYADCSRKLDPTKELALLKHRLSGERVKPATRKDLDARFLANPAVSVLHFICHGEAEVEDDDVIILDDEQELKSGYLTELEGFTKLCGESKPLVFLNACDVARQVHSVAGGAGFPRAFAEIGARAIIAPLWPVHKDLAGRIAVDIYEAALEPNPPTLAQVVRDVRAHAYEEAGVDTYAAYCFYGDPLTRLVVEH